MGVKTLKPSRGHAMTRKRSHPIDLEAIRSQVDRLNQRVRWAEVLANPDPLYFTPALSVGTDSTAYNSPSILRQSGIDSLWFYVRRVSAAHSSIEKSLLISGTNKEEHGGVSNASKEALRLHRREAVSPEALDAHAMTVAKNIRGLDLSEESLALLLKPIPVPDPPIPPNESQWYNDGPDWVFFRKNLREAGFREFKVDADNGDYSEARSFVFEDWDGQTISISLYTNPRHAFLPGEYFVGLHPSRTSTWRDLQRLMSRLFINFHPGHTKIYRVDAYLDLAATFKDVLSALQVRHGRINKKYNDLIDPETGGQTLYVGGHSMVVVYDRTAYYLKKWAEASRRHDIHACPAFGRDIVRIECRFKFRQATLGAFLGRQALASDARLSVLELPKIQFLDVFNKVRMVVFKHPDPSWRDSKLSAYKSFLDSCEDIGFFETFKVFNAGRNMGRRVGVFFDYVPVPDLRKRWRQSVSAFFSAPRVLGPVKADAFHHPIQDLWESEALASLLQRYGKPPKGNTTFPHWAIS
jgi:hypothetical protein